MATVKLERSDKKQKGQFLTPEPLAEKIVKHLDLSGCEKVLEPSFGDGSFLVPLLEKMLDKVGWTQENYVKLIENNVYGVELDKTLYDKALASLEERFWKLPEKHNFYNADFFDVSFDTEFDLVVGNPPFGGSFNPLLERALDRKYGRFQGAKVKKETYSFFTMKSLDLLSSSGKLCFILSDSFLTIGTMRGLRKRLLSGFTTSVAPLSVFSDETNYGMVLVESKAGGEPCLTKYDSLEAMLSGTKDKTVVDYSLMELTPNFSWGEVGLLDYYRDAPLMSEYYTCSSGIVTGRNDLFLREIDENGFIVENKKFFYEEVPLTVESEVARFKGGVVSERTRKKIESRVANGETLRRIGYVDVEPFKVRVPNSEYHYYNKAQSKRFYASPKTVIIWGDDGKLVKTFKKSGLKHLHGVGGAKYYGREGFTWQLISSQIKARFLPEGFILCTSSPAGFLKKGVDRDELFYAIAYLNSSVATEIMKKVLNHTKNIQGKDVEKLPYPSWVSVEDKKNVIAKTKTVVNALIDGLEIDLDEFVSELNSVFEKKKMSGGVE